ncbi:HAMP domain-containing protein [Propionivibrio sp.]|uniref:HAMP domain-containing protein n=1 Tax=Propionivibrio sp. TaxID=2212460 RepID=UPI003BF158E3
MSILNPAVRLVGRLSFRNKLRATALVFGLPLLVALGVILAGLGARVSAVQYERQALAVQIPALTLLANLHQYLAASQALREGAEQLGGQVQAQRERTERALKSLESAIAEHPLLAGKLTANTTWLTNWNAAFQQVESADADGMAELHSQLRTALRTELDKLNESAGLLVDGDTSSSRLIDIMTANLPELIDNTGQAARLGAVVLVNQRVKSSRRTELTLLRGNFNALVQWSMDNLQKIAREHPGMAANLEDASSRLNTAYLGVQEAMTTKMLDTTDFDLSPAAYLELTGAAFDQSLVVTGTLMKEADLMLADRQALLEAQRNAVVVAMVLILSLVIAGFVAAYISIMRGLNDLSDAVNTMASGDLSARVEITTSDEIGAVGTQFNSMVESLAQRTALLREKTNDIHNMLQHMPQGILTIVAGGAIHPEYSAYLETIFEAQEVAGQAAIKFIFGNGNVGSDALSQVAAMTSACIGEDRMNYDFNSHLLPGEVNKTMPDGRIKSLELSWSPILDDTDTVEKIMVCVRDVSELRQLEAEAEHQKRELQMIGQILSVNQEKFHEFVDSSRKFVAENEALLQAADDKHPELVSQLFRNMHTIKGNARTYGLLHLTNVVHEAEQAYDELRKNSEMAFAKEALLNQLQGVMCSIEEYASLNEVKLGRKGPGRRGSAEKYVMVQRTQVEQMVADLEIVDLHNARPEALAMALKKVKLGLRLVGTESIHTILDGVFGSLPSLARELGKEPPKLQINEHGVHLKNQVSDLVRNVFMHLYRNSMDHGIETAADRQAKGKSPTGTIQLDLAVSGGQLVMRLKDDGKGLALGHMRNKAMDKGLLPHGKPAHDEDIARLIFAAGFSTATAVTEVSGRGVGMDAVQEFIKREGGEIQLKFTDNKSGAHFRSFETVITLPAKFAVDTLHDVEHHDRAEQPKEHKEHKKHGDLRSMVTEVKEFLLPGKFVTA